SRSRQAPNRTIRIPQKARPEDSWRFLRKFTSTCQRKEKQLSMSSSIDGKRCSYHEAGPGDRLASRSAPRGTEEIRYGCDDGTDLVFRKFRVNGEREYAGGEIVGNGVLLIAYTHRGKTFLAMERHGIIDSRTNTMLRQPSFQ